MKKYVIEHSQYVEKEGLSGGVISLFNTKEEAYVCLADEYRQLIQTFGTSKETYEFDKNELTKKSYYISATSNKYGREQYEAFICEITIDLELTEPNEDFNGMTPKDAMEYINDFFSEWLNENEGYDDERLSDAIKRMQQLVDEL